MEDEDFFPSWLLFGILNPFCQFMLCSQPSCVTLKLSAVVLLFLELGIHVGALRLLRLFMSTEGWRKKKNRGRGFEFFVGPLVSFFRPLTHREKKYSRIRVPTRKPTTEPPITQTQSRPVYTTLTLCPPFYPDPSPRCLSPIIFRVPISRLLSARMIRLPSHIELISSTVRVTT